MPDPQPLSSNITEDFRAPEEATRPYQEHLLRVKQAYAAADNALLGVRLGVFKGIDFSPDEATMLELFFTKFNNLNLTIQNKSLEERPDELPAKGTALTV